MILADSWSGPYDVIAASEPNRLPACLSIFYAVVADFHGGMKMYIAEVKVDVTSMAILTMAV